MNCDGHDMFFVISKNGTLTQIEDFKNLTKAKNYAHELKKRDEYWGIYIAAGDILVDYREWGGNNQDHGEKIRKGMEKHWKEGRKHRK